MKILIWILAVILCLFLLFGSIGSLIGIEQFRSVSTIISILAIIGTGWLAKRLSNAPIRKCPLCEKKILLGAVINSNRYDSPIRTCPECNYVYFDNYYKEIAIESISNSSKWVLTPIGLGASVLLILSIGMLLYLSVKYGFYFGMLLGFNQILISVICLIIILINILGYNKRSAHIREEETKSKVRCSDPDYIAALKKLGYKGFEKMP